MPTDLITDFALTRRGGARIEEAPADSGLTVTAPRPEIIPIMPDTLRRHIRDYLNAHIAYQTTKTRWHLPLTLLVPCIIAWVITGTFRSFGPVSGSNVAGGFGLLTFAFAVWFLVAFFSPKPPKPMTEEEFLNNCRESAGGKRKR